MIHDLVPKIDHVKLENFKCFREQKVPFGALTVLAGLNGSGKSSVIQGMLALHQRWKGHEAPTLLSPEGLHQGGERLWQFFVPPWRGPLVNLGSFRDVLHEDAGADVVRIEIAFTSGAEMGFEDHPPDEDNHPDHVGQVGLGRSDEHAHLWFPDRIYYVSADRLGPRRVLPYTNDGYTSVNPLGNRGEHVLWYLEEYGSVSVVRDARHPGEPKSSLAAQTNAWLGTISPGAELRIKLVSEADYAVGSYRFSRPGDVPSRPFRAGNVGFGVSYVLPPIVALLATKQHGHPHLVIIENPEAHLHPGGQTALAELAARATASGSQVILETHSDHVLDGVRLAVREGILSPDQVVINYFEREGLDVRVTTPVLSKDGRLDVWPEGFFDQHERNLSRLMGLPNT